MPNPQRVLIVDPNPETRGVLRTLVERLGAEGIEAKSVAQSCQVAERERPDLVVIDADSAGTPDAGSTAPVREWADANGVPVVVLGTKRTSATPSGGEFLRKPYHFATLAHRIRGTLASRRAA